MLFSGFYEIFKNTYFAKNLRTVASKIWSEFKIFAKFTFTGKHLYRSLFLNKAAGWRPVTLLKSDSATSGFISILQNIWEHLLCQTPANSCFLDLNRISKRIWSKSETHLKWMWNEFKVNLKRIRSEFEVSVKRIMKWIWNKLKVHWSEF